MGEEEAERKLEEERRQRERNVIWRGVEGDDEEKRFWLVEEIVKRTLGREVGIRGVVKRREKRKMDLDYRNEKGEGQGGNFREKSGDREAVEGGGG